MTILIALAMAAVVFILIALYEFDNAPIVDEKAPLFHDDYDPSKDYTIKHGNIFCANCKFFDGIDMCLLKVNFGKIGDDSVKNCKLNGLFNAK